MADRQGLHPHNGSFRIAHVLQDTRPYAAPRAQLTPDEKATQAKDAMEPQGAAFNRRSYHSGREACLPAVIIPRRQDHATSVDPTRAGALSAPTRECKP
jgi:hypothetical protein